MTSISDNINKWSLKPETSLDKEKCPREVLFATVIMEMRLSRNTGIANIDITV